jgi:prepilin-type N-terminal cleavage/methylation domain-containing protein
MKKRDNVAAVSSRRSPRRSRRYGFSLIELLISMAVFLVVTAAAIHLFTKHAPMFNLQQNMAGVNMTMRNALSQMQLDAVNAGSGYYPGIDIAGWPVGITLVKGAGGGCSAPGTWTYAQTCFDSMTVITADRTKPAAKLAAAINSQATTNTTLLLDPGFDPTTGALMTVAATAASFHTGDEVLLVSSVDGNVTTVNLTANGAVSGAQIQLTHTATLATGVNPAGPGFDPLLISSAGDDGGTVYNILKSSFGPDTWVIKLTSVTFYVNAADPTNPKLMRCPNCPSPLAGGDVIAEQVIGFKVGVSLKKDDITDTSCADYYYDPTTYAANCTGGTPEPKNWSRIRSVRVTVIGRTDPKLSPDLTYRNGYDQGPYYIQALSTVINPRALSMRDDLGSTD